MTPTAASGAPPATTASPGPTRTAPASSDPTTCAIPESLRRTAGVPSKQVAEWAGHSVEVLERIYSKVLEGYDERWQQEMDEFF
ncbi:hypothetical protein GCM10029992_37290 [Glycomyces albus]